MKEIKATVRCSGRVVTVIQQRDKFVEHVGPDDDIIWTANELDFSKTVDYKDVVIQTAIRVLQGFAASGAIGIVGTDNSEYVKASVAVGCQLANELKSKNI